MSSWLLPSTAQRTLRSTAAAVASGSSSGTSSAFASTSQVRHFSVSVPALKKSNRARGAKRLSPRNAALLAATSNGGSFKRITAPVKRSASTAAVTEKREDLFKIEDACELLKASKGGSLSAFEAHIVTTVSSHQTNALRGRIAFPRDPRTKQERLLVFAEEGSAVHDAVKQLGPDGTDLILGGSDMIENVVNNRVSGFTKVLCTNTLLPDVSRSLARSLGPKGLMPNIRRGTVVPSDDESKILAAIKLAKGATDWRSDKVGVVRGAIGRFTFEPKQVRDNLSTLLEAILEKVPTLGTAQTSAAAQQAASQPKEFVQREARTPSELKRGTWYLSLLLSLRSDHY